MTPNRAALIFFFAANIIAGGRSAESPHWETCLRVSSNPGLRLLWSEWMNPDGEESEAGGGGGGGDVSLQDRPASATR